MTTTKSGHCCHCVGSCQFHQHPDCWAACCRTHHGTYATWSDGRCPACAEAERIAAAIEAKRAHPINEGKDAYDIRYALTDAARIARGEA